MVIYHRQPHLWRHPKSRTWYVVWRDGRSTLRRSTRTRERVTAENELFRILRERAAEPAWNKPRSLTVHAAAAEWVELKSKARAGLAASTLADYRMAMKKIVEAAPAGMHVDGATPRDLRQLLSRIEVKYDLGPTSMKNYQNHLSMLFGWLHREGVIARNPAASLDRVKLGPAPVRGVSEALYARILAAIDKDIAGTSGPAARLVALEVRDLVEVLWYSGLRSIEAYRMGWDDVDLAGEKWIIRSPANKGGVREMPMHERVLSIFRRRRLQGGPAPFSRYGTQNAWMNFRRRHGHLVKKIRLHDLRHAFITRLVAAGNLAAARHLGRHRTPAMTDLYSQIDSETFRKALAGLA